MNSISFKDLVFEVVKNIPAGSYMTYKEVAVMIGRPKASRAVGNILSNNYDVNIPCHRVIRTDGKMGGYNRGGDKEKLNILKKEGAKLS